MKTVYAVDIDGTLTNSGHTPNQPVIDRVNSLYNNPQNLIIIYTARSSQIRSETENLLRTLGVRYHALVMDKLRADHYIDDRNVLPHDFENWST